MPKEYFSADRITPLASVPPNGRIYFIGVAGVAMGQLAIALSKQGYQVAGSDKQFYEPMGGILRSSSVQLYEGYCADNLPTPPDLVVIGNAVSYGHPEVAVVEEHRYPYTSFPHLVREVVIGHRHSIVVAGTHGKTTTTAMAASALIRANLAPSIFVGGAVPELPQSLVVGEGKVSVVEGDEYDSAFFAKVPKFSLYGARTLVVNAIEFDHGDIYPNVEAIVAQFLHEVDRMPSGGTVIASSDYAAANPVIGRARARGDLTVLTFGSANADIILGATSHRGDYFVTPFSGVRQGEVRLLISGRYNAANAVAAALALETVGVPLGQTLSTLSSFHGVRRRLEQRAAQSGRVVIEDFAHHPTALREALEAVRLQYPDKRLIAVFEPRSNTSRSRVFFDEYLTAFARADVVAFLEPERRPGDRGDDLIDIPSLITRLGRPDRPAFSAPDAHGLANKLIAEFSTGTVVVVMSNGSCGGLVGMLVAFVSRPPF